MMISKIYNTTLSLLLIIPTIIIGASSSKNKSIQLGAKSLQELAYRAVGQDQQFHVYRPWAPLDIEQTSCAIIDELEHRTSAHDDPAHVHQKAMCKIWAHEGVTAVAEDIAYILNQKPNMINSIFWSIEFYLKMSNEIFAQTQLVRKFESLVEQLQYWPDANRLRTISTKLINGLDHRRPTYTQTKKAYTKYFDKIIKNAEVQNRHELVAKLVSLVQRYNDLGLQVTLPAAWSTNAVTVDILITSVPSQEELDIKARAYKQCFHIYPVQYYLINAGQTRAAILAALSQHQVNPPLSSWIREGIMQSMRDHRLLKESPYPQKIAWYHNKFDELETMLAQQDFSAETLKKIKKTLRKISIHKADLPTPEKLITSCNRIIDNLDRSRCTYERIFQMYATWRDKEVAVIHELNRRYALIQQQYNDQEIDKK